MLKQDHIKVREQIVEAILKGDTSTNSMTTNALFNREDKPTEVEKTSPNDPMALVLERIRRDREIYNLDE
jgi:hypothetical protein